MDRSNMSDLARTAFALISFSLALSTQLPSQSTPCESARDIDRIAKIRNPSGWDVSMVNLSRPTRSVPRYDGAVESEVELRSRYFRYTGVVMHSCDQIATIVPKYLRVEHAYGISSSGRTFAVVLRGNCGELVKGRWIAALCDASIALVATSGSGKFDLLEIGEGIPDMPQWVHRPK